VRMVLTENVTACMTPKIRTRMKARKLDERKANGRGRATHNKTKVSLENGAVPSGRLVM